MRARLMDDTALYAQMSLDGPAPQALAADTEVMIGETHEQDEQAWVAVTVVDGEASGYVPGDTQLFVIKRAKLASKLADLYTGPSDQGVIKEVISRGKAFDIVDILETANQRWVKVRDDEGNVGFLPGQTRIELVQERQPPDMAAMLRGWGWGLIAMGLLSVALSTYLSPIWGAVLAVLGAAVLLVQKRIMFILIGGALVAAGLFNLVTRELSGWSLVAVLQIYWGLMEVRRYKRFTDQD